ncbi:MAG TPA: hypothetical protein VN862_01435 [Candidatus Acidoferrales bacterium]|nr:hypothetical protein [Candidatus Acidoferrales bacterium]
MAETRSTSPKRPYQTPELKTYGDVRVLTQSSRLNVREEGFRRRT